MYKDQRTRVRGSWGTTRTSEKGLWETSYGARTNIQECSLWNFKCSLRNRHFRMPRDLDLILWKGKMIKCFRKHTGVCGFKIHSGYSVEDGLKRETGSWRQKKHEEGQEQKGQDKFKIEICLGLEEGRWEWTSGWLWSLDGWTPGNTMNTHSIRKKRNNLQSYRGVTHVFLLSRRHQ